jgi:hypothetical protein
MSKRDMYINYERSLKKRGRKRGNGGKLLLIALLVIGLGAAVFITLKNNLSHIGQRNKQENTQSGDASDQNSAIGDTGDNTDNSMNTPVTTAETSPTPAISPTAPVTDNTGAAQSGNEVDTRTPTVVKGLYVTAPAAGTSKLDKIINIIDTTEINALVIDIKDDHGKISYRMNNVMATNIGATTNMIKDMPGLVKTLKDKGVYLIARIVAFKDPYLAEKRPDLAIKNKDGSLYKDTNGEGWVNPYNKEVWDYLVGIATQAADIGFDEIQFDYIRFSTGGTIAEADFGEKAKTVSKEDIIIEFTKYAYEVVKPRGVFISADVFGAIINSEIDAGRVGQNYIEMSKYLDYICPMIYPSHYASGNYGVQYPDLEPYTIINKALIASKMKLTQIPEDEHRAIVRPWLQDFTATWIKPHKVYGGAEIREQINGVYDAGYSEWLLWNAASNYSEDGLLTQEE